MFLAGDLSVVRAGPQPGGQDLCAILGTQGIQSFLLGYPTGKVGDQGDRTEFCVPSFYVPFSLREKRFVALPPFPWKLKPGFINRVLVAVIFEASKCL